ncbi:MAG TPA: ribonuclease H-like domain-containing protein [Candidatus Acidoferrales bacterium]|nr:ribonuclease H-like domain-containing protein [Candidatus Acidoferrales bacterium]
MSNTVHDRFARLAALRPARKGLVSPDEPSRGIAPDMPYGAERLEALLGAATARNRFGEHLALRRWFPEAVGGEAAGGDFEPAGLRLFAPGAPIEAEDSRQWLFLDTETTGLAGGTGTYPFLVGIAWWDAGGLEVEQFFMREQSEEHSLLVALAERMAERRVLVTFNGKSFDWPLLETRYRMTRTIQPPAPRAHLDFLHPARNLWRLRLGSVRLAELERHVLGWNRGADVMSELIPQIYFNYLRGGPPEPLVPVFHHNQMDLRGLVGLATRILSLLANPESQGRDALELYGVSRICERRGEAVRAKKLYQRSIAADLPPETGRAARRSLARLAKRDGDFDLARALWEGLAGNSREGFEAYEQLAIYFEHRAGVPHRAAELSRKALAELRKANRLGTIAPVAYRRQREQFERRLARLERKAGRDLLLALDAESKSSPNESN